MNPLTLLDSLLADWASPRVRRLVHGLLTIAAMVVTAYFAAEQDWSKAIAALVAMFYTEANRANTPATPLTSPDDIDETDDGLTYEEAGGGSY